MEIPSKYVDHESIPNGYIGWVWNKPISRFYYVINGYNMFHNLTGPTRISVNSKNKILEVEYFISGERISAQNYWQHPDVIQETANAILEL